MEPHVAQPYQEIDLSPLKDSGGAPMQGSGAPHGFSHGGLACGNILDTTTPPDDTVSGAERAFWAAIDAPRSRRIWSRCRLGFHLPGDYYFTTMTTSPDAIKPITEDVFPLRRWFKRHHPGYEYLQVITNEGNGVAHIVQRLPSGSKRIDVKALRAYWIVTHQTAILKIKPVGSRRDNLAKYLAEQSVKGMAAELSYQPMIIKWSRSKNWIPPHFIKEWGRWWHEVTDLTIEQKDVHSREWIREIHRNR